MMATFRTCAARLYIASCLSGLRGINWFKEPKVNQNLVKEYIQDLHLQYSISLVTYIALRLACSQLKIQVCQEGKKVGSYQFCIWSPVLDLKS